MKPARHIVWVLLLMAPGCADDDGGSSGQVACDPGAAPVFLHSKVDDDDGDGIILDEDYPAIDDEDDDIADHAWIRDDEGLYHLFHHSEGLYEPTLIQHYTSRDLRRLEYVGVALRPDPDGWDSHALWAPHVVRSGGAYYMFYTGTKGVGASAVQRIGLATSTDLDVWTRHPVNRCPGTSGTGCVYECDESWTTWGGPQGSFNQQCRDAFVIRDDDAARWTMFATARSTNGFGVVTAAVSADLIEWRGAGFVDATRRLASGTGGQPTGGEAENPFVMVHEGVYYLLFTDWRDTEDSVTTTDTPRTLTQYAVSSSLSVDSLGSAGWGYAGYTTDPGVNAIEVQELAPGVFVMSQSISNKNAGPDHDHHRRALRLRCVVWEGDGRFRTENVALPVSGRLIGP